MSKIKKVEICSREHFGACLMNTVDFVKLFIYLCTVCMYVCIYLYNTFRFLLLFLCLKCVIELLLLLLFLYF